MKMNRILAVVVAVVAGAAVVSFVDGPAFLKKSVKIETPAVAVPEGNLIVPGAQVGKFKIGQSAGKDQAKLQAAAQKQALVLQFNKAGAVSAIHCTNPLFRTAGGVGVGSAKADVQKALGAPLANQAVEQVEGAKDLPALAYAGATIFLKGDKVFLIAVHK